MFSNNERISAKQLKKLIVLDLISVTGIILPKIAASLLGKDGSLGIIIATVYALIFTWIMFLISKEIKESYLDYINESVGSFFTFIIGLFYCIKILFTCVLIVRLFSEVIKATLLYDTDLPIIILLLLLVSSYMATKGFEVRARVAEIIYLFVLLPVFGLLLFGVKNIERSNLMPLYNSNIEKIVSGSYSVFLIFTLLDLLLFCIPMVRTYNTSSSGKRKKKARSVYSYVAGAILIVSVFNLLIFITAIGILGSKEVSRNLWSSITTLQIIELPGNAIQRQDGLMIGIWTVSIFTLISGFIYYLTYIGKGIIRIKNRQYLSIPILLIIFGISIIPIETDKMFLYYETYMYYIGIPLSLIIPLLILLIHKLRNKWIKKPIKHLALPFVLVFSLSIITGCSDMTEIEDRDFVQVIGIDYLEGEATLYFILPNLLSLTGQDSHDEEKLLVTISGDNFYEIEEQYGLQSSKKIDFSHMKAIVINKGILKDSQVLEDFLEYVKEKNKISRNLPVFLSSSSISELFSINGKLNGGIGKYLEQIYDVNLIRNGNKKRTISDLILSMDNQNLTSYLPILNMEKEVLKVMNIGILSEDKLVYELDNKNVNYFFVLQGYGENSIVFVDQDNLGLPYGVKIESIKRKIDFLWKDNKPYLKIKFTGKGNIGGQSLEEEVFNQFLKNEITLIMDEIIKIKKIDFMNLYSMTSYKNRDMWFQYETDPILFLEELVYEIKVDIKLN